MANLTAKQYKDICSKCENGFTLDLNRITFWNEKQLTKMIQIDEKFYIEAVLWFHEETKREGWSTYQIGVTPYLTINKLRDTAPGEKSNVKCYHTVQLSEQAVGEMIARRNMKVLCKLTAEYTEEKILSLVADEVAKIKKAA